MPLSGMAWGIGSSSGWGAAAATDGAVGATRAATATKVKARALGPRMGNSSARVRAGARDRSLQGEYGGDTPPVHPLSRALPELACSTRAARLHPGRWWQHVGRPPRREP